MSGIFSTYGLSGNLLESFGFDAELVSNLLGAKMVQGYIEDVFHFTHPEPVYQQADLGDLYQAARQTEHLLAQSIFLPPPWEKLFGLDYVEQRVGMAITGPLWGEAHVAANVARQAYDGSETVTVMLEGDLTGPATVNISEVIEISAF